MSDYREQGRDFAKQVKNAEWVASVVFVSEAQKDDTVFDEITILEHARLFPVWDEYWTGRRGSIVQDEGQLYRAIHDVGVGQNTKPSQTPSMWTLIGNPAEEFPKWVQPLGAHDAYMQGDKVTHNGKQWVSDANGNIWEPGVWGWTEFVN